MELTEDELNEMLKDEQKEYGICVGCEYCGDEPINGKVLCNAYGFPQKVRQKRCKCFDPLHYDYFNGYG